MSDEIEYGTPADMLLALGDPECPWTLEQRYIAAGHILTDWQENAAMQGAYEQMRHTWGIEDEKTVHDLSADDVFEVAEQVWRGVQEGRFADPRGRQIITVGDLPDDRVQRF